MSTIGVRGERYECAHTAAAVCLLCSDQDPRWREWRIGMGLGEEPPNLNARLAKDEARRIIQAAIDQHAERASAAALRGWERAHIPGAGYAVS